MYEFSELGWIKHVIFHPVEGFEDLRWKKRGSLKYAFIIVGLLFISMVASERLKGFQYTTEPQKLFNIVPIIVQSVVYFATWVVGNWAICTLLDGEGTMKKVCINSAYALVPFIVGTYISVFLSNFMTLDESVWVYVFQYVGIGWSVILMIQGMRAVHQYSFSKTILSMVLTVVAMLIILFLAVLLISLFQQVYAFFYQIYTEITYRVRG